MSFNERPIGEILQGYFLGPLFTIEQIYVIIKALENDLTQNAIDRENIIHELQRQVGAKMLSFIDEYKNKEKFKEINKNGKEM